MLPPGSCQQTGLCSRSRKTTIGRSSLSISEMSIVWIKWVRTALWSKRRKQMTEALSIQLSRDMVQPSGGALYVGERDVLGTATEPMTVAEIAAGVFKFH